MTVRDVLDHFNANSFGRRRFLLLLMLRARAGHHHQIKPTCDVTTTTLQSMDHSTYLRRNRTE
jgi:hypothetical protein